MPLIDIGSTKQLFLDDYLIESMANVKQVLNPAVKVDNKGKMIPVCPGLRSPAGLGTSLDGEMFFQIDPMLCALKS